MPVTLAGCVQPTAYELHQLQMELFPRYLNNGPGLEILPIRETEDPFIVLNQPDSFMGLQGHRGLGKPTEQVFPRYNPWGTYRQIVPGYWGEHDQLDEEILTNWADPNRCGQVFDATAHINRLQQRLLERRANRVLYNIWQLLTFGRYTALDSSGQTIFEGQFNIQNIVVPIPWTNFPGSFPLRDFRTVKLLQRGSSVSFGTCARAYMNQETANLLFANTNTIDVGRIGLSACCTFMSPEMINQQFAAQGLPQIVVTDEGYLDDSGVFNTFIPFGKVIIVGCRPNNEPIGNYWLTRNAVGCSITSGFWQKLTDTCEMSVPRKIILYDGHNGGPALHYSRGIVVLTVA